MATNTTRQGWPVLTGYSDPHLVGFEWVTGKVRNDVVDVFDAFLARFHSEVEPVKRDQSWGYAPRAVRGSSAPSEHSAGTAVDINAPAHPMGKRGTFTATQEKALRALLDDFPLIEWGGDWPGRPDEMHFEMRKGKKMVTMCNPAVGYVSSGYGYRERLNSRIAAMFHAGLDIAPRNGKAGAPVLAAFAGTVVKAGRNIVAGRTGNGVLIKNPDGEQQYYGHLATIAVNKGQQVAMGQRLGTMGATGNVTGVHLHFETWASNGRLMNPASMFRLHGVTPGVSNMSEVRPAGKAATKRPPYYTRVIDGVRGAYQIAAEQRFLADRGHYKRAIDGKDGYYTVLAWQSYLSPKWYKRAKDGKAGTWTIKALQSWLKASGHYAGVIDGYAGPMTNRAVQTMLVKNRIK